MPQVLFSYADSSVRQRSHLQERPTITIEKVESICSVGEYLRSLRILIKKEEEEEEEEEQKEEAQNQADNGGSHSHVP